jgi:hypothetical protein
MKHLFHSALALHLLLSSQLGDARAAGPYDGEWIGSATSTIRRCKPANVRLIVQGREVTCPWGTSNNDDFFVRSIAGAAGR